MFSNITLEAGGSIQFSAYAKIIGLIANTDVDTTFSVKRLDGSDNELSTPLPSQALTAGVPLEKSLALHFNANEKLLIESAGTLKVDIAYVLSEVASTSGIRKSVRTHFIDPLVNEYALPDAAGIVPLADGSELWVHIGQLYFPEKVRIDADTEVPNWHLNVAKDSIVFDIDLSDYEDKSLELRVVK